MNGIWFNDKHSYYDFGLILNSKDIPLPDVKTHLVDIPGADGQLDLSTSLTNGIPKYKNRKCKFEFTLPGPYRDSEEVKSKIANYLHGRIMKVTQDYDPEFYFKGRTTIDDWNTEDSPITLTIEVDAEPYKYRQEEKVIEVNVSGTKNVLIETQLMPTVPTFYSSSDITVICDGLEYFIPQNEEYQPDIVLYEETTITLKGTAKVKISYQEGEL